MKDKTKWMSRVYLILVIFTFGIVWQICSDKGIVNELFFSSPKKVIADFIDMFVTGYIFPHIKITLCITKISTFLILCDLAVCLATLYVSFSLVFALMRYLQGKVFLIRFYSPTTLSSSRAEFRLPSRLACA